MRPDPCRCPPRLRRPAPPRRDALRDALSKPAAARVLRKAGTTTRRAKTRAGSCRQRLARVLDCSMARRGAHDFARHPGESRDPVTFLHIALRHPCLFPRRPTARVTFLSGKVTKAI